MSIITAQAVGRCAVCNAPYSAGARLYAVNSGIVHPTCKGRRNPPVTAAGVQRKRPEGFRIG